MNSGKVETAILLGLTSSRCGWVDTMPTGARSRSTTYGTFRTCGTMPSGAIAAISSV